MPSSVVAAINYYTETSTLRIRYVSGAIYDYKDVPKEVYVAMKASASKGTFLRLEIKDKYAFERIKP